MTEEMMNDERAAQVAAYAEARGKKGAVLTREILKHGKHILFQERDPKCLRCYPTISMN